MTIETNTVIALPDTAKVWVYQSHRPFTADENTHIESVLSEFMQAWKSHGDALHADFAVLYDYFIVLGVDESVSGASGCSIDSSVKVIKELGATLGIDLLDKSQIAYQTANDANEIHTIDFRKVKEAVTSSIIKKDTLVYNNQVTSLGELKQSWLLKAEQTWMAKYFS